MSMSCPAPVSFRLVDWLWKEPLLQNDGNQVDVTAECGVCEMVRPLSMNLLLPDDGDRRHRDRRKRSPIAARRRCRSCRSRGPVMTTAPARARRAVRTDAYMNRPPSLTTERPRGSALSSASIALSRSTHSRARRAAGRQAHPVDRSTRRGAARDVPGLLEPGGPSTGERAGVGHDGGVHPAPCAQRGQARVASHHALAGEVRAVGGAAVTVGLASTPTTHRRP